MRAQPDCYLDFMETLATNITNLGEQKTWEANWDLPPCPEEPVCTCFWASSYKSPTGSTFSIICCLPNAWSKKKKSLLFYTLRNFSIQNFHDDIRLQNKFLVTHTSALYERTICIATIKNRANRNIMCLSVS